ncbi:3TM-type holin [Pseudooceanicola algae]|uniref:Holin of 3TMs, for gene-transfer release n=1 Tax=Pseudooceanicola algae TaxID=1537215 RepID=A0A418SKA2_9RHOB|nr:3TM-type holin [Pseudooceanicola algae]QPM89166.1 hypothetical protein PSAL_003770 [Pseudooceanicola algae]
MGVISTITGALFGAGGNVIQETAEVFVPNAEASAQRASDGTASARAQFAAEFTGATGGFNGFVNALNRLPRPILALGVIFLMGAAMADPLWYTARMQALALTPDPLWQGFGLLMLFFFGGRMQVTAAQARVATAALSAQVPKVIESIAALRELRAESAGVADTGSAADLTLDATEAGDNPALAAWRQAQG